MKPFHCFSRGYQVQVLQQSKRLACDYRVATRRVHVDFEWNEKIVEEWVFRSACVSHDVLGNCGAPRSIVASDSRNQLL